MNVSLYNNFKDIKNKDVSLDEIALIMKGGFLRDQTDQIRLAKTKNEEARIKDGLPLILGYGTFNGRKLIENLNEPNGLLFFDYDEYKGEDIAPVVKQVILDKLGDYLALMFTSPRYGVKFALRTTLNTHNNDYYQYVYRELVDIIESLTELKLDSSTCNLNRNTYIVDDPNVYVNIHAEALPLDFKDAFNESKKIQEAEIALAKSKLDTTKINKTLQHTLAEQAVNRYSRLGNGERHKGIAALGWRLFSLSYDVNEVSSIFLQLKNTGHYTETIAPATAAKTLHGGWNGELEAQIFCLSLKEKMKILHKGKT